MFYSSHYLCLRLIKFSNQEVLLWTPYRIFSKPLQQHYFKRIILADQMYKTKKTFSMTQNMSNHSLQQTKSFIQSILCPPKSPKRDAYADTPTPVAIQHILISINNGNWLLHLNTATKTISVCTVVSL